jgi:SAM-dependent methyltransferase
MQVSPVQAAYDAIAVDYESAVAPSSWVRERLWKRLEVLFPPGSRVLDVTAGTGLDARHLAARGIAVTACDLSPGMLARLAAVAPEIPACVADFNHLEETGIAGPFDGLISTFAGLNAAADLFGFARAAARMIRPGGVLFLHVLNPRRRGRRLAVRIAGVEVSHRLWTPRELAGEFAPNFVVSGLRGQGILRSVDAQNGGGDRTDRWERLASGVPGLRSLGTFFSLELTRREERSR